MNLCCCRAGRAALLKGCQISGFPVLRPNFRRKLTSMTDPEPSDAVRDLVENLAKQMPTPTTLQQMKAAAAPLERASVRLSTASFLHRELQVRWARAVKTLSTLPPELATNASVLKVQYRLYRYMQELSEMGPPASLDEDADFTAYISAMKMEDGITAPAVAKGLRELREREDMKEVLEQNSLQEQITATLDEFFLNRIGIRMLIGQHVDGRESVGGRVTRIEPAEVAREAVDRATKLCTQIHGRAPPVTIRSAGDNSEPFVYVRSHFHHMIFELVKNSMRALVERPALPLGSQYSRNRKVLPRVMDPCAPMMGFVLPEYIPEGVEVHAPVEYCEGDELPGIQVVISSGKEDIAVKVADQGGGIPRSDWHKLWYYTYTTAPKPTSGILHPDVTPDPGLGPGRGRDACGAVSFDRAGSSSIASAEKAEEDAGVRFRDHFSGGGYGLPIARLFARYFGGNLTIYSLEGYGTDAYVQLHRLGTNYEVIPGATKTTVRPISF